MAGEPVRESIIPAQENRGSDTVSSSTASRSPSASSEAVPHGHANVDRNANADVTVSLTPAHAAQHRRDERDVKAWDEEDGASEEIVALSREEAERLFGPGVSRPSRVTPMRVVGAQCLVTVCSMVVCGVLSQQAFVAALSALVGGVICWVPSAVFAMQLKARARTSTGSWMLAEGIKLGLTIAMFILVAVYFKEVRWFPLLITYALALKTYWLALAWK
jgi:ATP synthase protein I